MVNIHHQRRRQQRRADPKNKKSATRNSGRDSEHGLAAVAAAGRGREEGSEGRQEGQLFDRTPPLLHTDSGHLSLAPTSPHHHDTGVGVSGSDLRGRRASRSPFYRISPPPPRQRGQPPAPPTPLAPPLPRFTTPLESFSRRSGHGGLSISTPRRSGGPRFAWL